MEQPTLKSILSKNRPQTHIFVEELDERFSKFRFLLIRNFEIFV